MSLTKLVKSILRRLFFARFLLIPYRFYRGVKYYGNVPGKIIKWTLTSKEITNLTYELTELNKQYLAWFVATVTQTDVEKVKEYIVELENNENLKKHIRETTLKSDLSFIADLDAKYGRRLGWYAFVRIKKPKVVVETGIDKGLGSVVLATALMKNTEEGFPGHLYCTEINPDAGYLLKEEPFSKYGTIIYGDSIETLQKFDKQIDILITDSNHSQDYEYGEYETVKDKLTINSLIISDTADESSKLLEFAQQMNWNFLFFKEETKDTFFLGAGIGVAYKS